ncbi:arsenate reductase ArsC [Anaerococcus porci]|uniref:arsenate reductase ArsC n=1 Tax=Anaerococcus porci TaxID=2652269 RepID=UPI002A7569F6|nr:arsenate reductase ArsC [Anaerococcus porci]MDY3007394.1 arsenate reductase ArsC [Anaerococcus porci]
MKKIAFICTHNSCRSQISEALAKLYNKGEFEIFSAGTHLKNEINPDAIRLMKEIYNIDMSKSQKPKLIEDIGKVDYVVSMGCGVVCPSMDYNYEYIEWSIDDPSGKDDSYFKKIISELDSKIRNFLDSI